MATARTIRLMIVEDNEAYLYLIRRAFGLLTAKNQWTLTVAGDGQAALDLLFKEENQDEPLPDLILLDWKLPGVNGDKVLSRLKDHEKLRKIPVLVFSSSDADEDINQAYDCHANGYITKPKDLKMLESIVESVEQFWVAIANLPKVAR